MNYPVIITGTEFPAITQPTVKIRINAEPWTAKHLGQTFRTVDAEWFFCEMWRPIPRNSKQAIDIAALIDTGKIEDAANVAEFERQMQQASGKLF